MESKRIFLIIPFSAEFSDVNTAIRAAASRSEDETGFKYQIFRRGENYPGGRVSDGIYEGLAKADLVIADISGENPNVLYELGFAKALDLPVVLLNQRDSRVPFDITSDFIILYDRGRLTHDLVPNLISAISRGVMDPTLFMRVKKRGETDQRAKPSAFVSYSHSDVECLERLQVHIRPLEKEGVIDVWSDLKISAGEKWMHEIETALNRAVVAILLISADFLASEFIVENELPPILAAAENKGTKILPVILKPCRFERDKNLSQFQAVNSPGRPLLTLDTISQEQVWDDLARQIETEIKNWKLKQ